MALLSFIIPAHNEEAVLADTLRTLTASARTLHRPFEVLVVDDDSTDRTAAIGREQGATVVSVKLRKIAAVRNAGARLAKGDTLFFVDADTLVPAKTLQCAVAALERGAVGGGAWVRLDRKIPLWARLATPLFTLLYFSQRLAAGCFIFARQDVFTSIGGFDENYYVSEEIHLSNALKKAGRFVIIRHAVVTSGRKFRLIPAGQLLKEMLYLIWAGSESWKKRDHTGLWYDQHRERG